MSAARILILGVLRDAGPLHGYDIRRELETWDAEQWANIAYGSIYFALGKLSEEGLLEVVAAEGIKNRPARTIYAITDKGREEFERLLRDWWWQPRAVIDPIQVALTFMNKLPRKELLSVLRYRADLLRAHLAVGQRLDPTQPKGPGAPRHITENFRLMLMLGETRLRWLEELIGKVERGELP